MPYKFIVYTVKARVEHQQWLHPCAMVKNSKRKYQQCPSDLGAKHSIIKMDFTLWEYINLVRGFAVISLFFFLLSFLLSFLCGGGQSEEQ